MEDKEISIPETEECTLAHVDYETQRIQSMQEHAGNVALFLSNVCELPELKNLVELAGILHDAGKLGTKNQDDFKNILKLGDKVHKHGLDHSTAGGRLALELIKEWPVSEFISTLIYFHHGMECHITLSDGTKVHLNAESQLIYPVCFSNEQRIVQIKGEAYFDVAPDSEHPFIVQTPYTSIQVTGTTFNVRAYPDENIESTTLINGSIKIKSKNEDFELTPNQHFIFDKNSKRNTVTNVNTELYTSWESGSFIFKNIPLESVMSYLSKWYGFKYTFEDDAVKQVKIGAYLNRYANMNPIIDMIKELNLVDIKQREGVLHISYK